MADELVIAGRKFKSRLLIGTGKYATFELMREALEKSGAEIVTVAVRRINISDRSKESLLDYHSTKPKLQVYLFLLSLSSKLFEIRGVLYFFYHHHDQVGVHRFLLLLLTSEKDPNII